LNIDLNIQTCQERSQGVVLRFPGPFPPFEIKIQYKFLNFLFLKSKNYSFKEKCSRLLAKSFIMSKKYRDLIQRLYYSDFFKNKKLDTPSKNPDYAPETCRLKNSKFNLILFYIITIKLILPVLIFRFLQKNHLMWWHFSKKISHLMFAISLSIKKQHYFQFFIIFMKNIHFYYQRLPFLIDKRAFTLSSTFFLSFLIEREFFFFVLLYCFLLQNSRKV